MRIKINKIIGVILLLTILLVGFVSIQVYLTIKSPLNIKGTEEIVVNNGEGFYNVIEELSEQNKIKNITFIKMYAKLFKIDLETLPGKYSISEDMTIKELIKTLDSSTLNYTMMTIPEGYSIDDIALKVEEFGICSSNDFIKAINNYKTPDYVKIDNNKKYSLEGYLFPDTYSIDEYTTADDIIRAMLTRFEEQWNQVTQELNMSVKKEDIEKVIIIASIIEKEARIDEDRRLISSVIYNRIEQNMQLQFCSTVIYAHGYNIENLLYSHLEIESPYNTYKYSGLPVGPISNPGILSIKAALNPENTDYLYYLLETDNEHYFTNSYDDFLHKKQELGY